MQIVIFNKVFGGILKTSIKKLKVTLKYFLKKMLLLKLIFILATVEGLRYIINPDGSKEFDGVGIGIVSRPSSCDKTTQNGDLLKVHFNGSLGDKTVFDDR